MSTMPHLACEVAPSSAVHKALRASCRRPLDAYAVAKQTGYSPMACARRLSAMENAGEASSGDPHGTANDLARQFTLAG